jgi:peptide deformylase
MIGNPLACILDAQARDASPPIAYGRSNGYIASMSQAINIIPAGNDVPLLPILIVPQPILKARAKPVTPAHAAELAELIPRMFATMYKAPGIGLAAPQVGVGLRLAVVDIMPDEKPAPIVLINPEIVAAGKEMATREEGCLSIPNLYADVTRPERVRVRYTDAQGATKEIEADGLLAACLQHEIDHLDGVLFVDHISALKRNMILRKLAKDQKAKKG